MPQNLEKQSSPASENETVEGDHSHLHLPNNREKKMTCFGRGVAHFLSIRLSSKG
jgi:hypothetical protein